MATSAESAVGSSPGFEAACERVIEPFGEPIPDEGDRAAFANHSVALLVVEGELEAR